MNKKIVLASKSSVKRSIVEYVAKYLFGNDTLEITQFDVEDGGAEPVGEEALLFQIQSAIQKVRELEPKAEYYIAMEGGVRMVNDQMEEIAYVVIEDNSGRQSRSQSVSFPIPPEVAAQVQKGIPFADSVDAVYSTKDIKNNQGFVGLLTDNFIDKKALYMQPTAVAFGKFIKGEWFWK